MELHVFVLLCACAMFVQSSDINIGALETITDDVIDAPTTKSGKIPKWLKGYFLRQACGTLGDVRHMNDSAMNYVQHLFDCLPMHSQYRINGEADAVTFYNRYAQTIKTDIWRFYKMDMNDSKVYYPAILSTYDEKRYAFWRQNFSTSNKIESFGHVTWWEVNGDVLGKTETMNAEKVDLPTLDSSRYEFRDVNLGYPPGTFMTNNPAHEHTDTDGTLWSTMVVVDSNSVAKNAVYRVRDGYRTVVGEYTWGNVDLTQCSPNGHYPDLSARAGYMHSFGMTENYIILPTAAWLLDYCSIFLGGAKPFFRHAYQWYSNSTSKLIVMRKSDGVFIKTIETEGFFSTHQLNSYEKDGKIYLDMLTYPNADIYLEYTNTRSLLKEVEWTARIERFVIDIKSWTLTERRRLFGRDGAYEFSNINYEHYNGRPYKYAYMNNRPYLNNGGVIKLDVDTGEAVEYLAPSGVLPQEPVFVAAPNPTSEDDGVLLIQGYDANTNKGFMAILDAKTMREMSRVSAPDRALFGIHNKFFRREMAPPASTQNSASHLNVLWIDIIKYLSIFSLFVLFF